MRFDLMRSSSVVPRDRDRDAVTRWDCYDLRPMDVRLDQHYSERYDGRGAVSVVRPTRRPADRFEAALASLLQRFRGGSVLELGAGDGGVARALLGAMPSITSYSAIDLSPPRVAQMQAGMGDPRFRAMVGRAEEIPEEAGMADLIVMVAIIEHLVDPIGAMQRVRRHLRPGGMVYVDTPNIAKWTRRLKLALGRFPSTGSADEGLCTYGGEAVDLLDEGHLHYFTFASLSSMLVERCGFSKVVRLGYADRGLHRIVGARCASWLARTRPALFSDVAVIATV